MILNPKSFSNEILRQIRLIVKKQGNERELCGVIVAGSKVEVRQVTNISNSEGVEYQMDPVELGEATKDTDFLGGKPDKVFIGIWHTHPLWSSDPSSIDITNMLWGRWYFIYSCVDDDMSFTYKDKVK